MLSPTTSRWPALDASQNNGLRRSTGASKGDYKGAAPSTAAGCSGECEKLTYVSLLLQYQ